MGEYLSVLGIPPTAYTNPKEIAKAWRDIAHEYNRERAYATSEFLKTGKMEEVQRFEAKWKVPIKPEDLAKAVEISQMSPEARGMRNVEKTVRALQLQQQPWLVGNM